MRSHVGTIVDPDVALIQACRNGNARSFALLVDRHKDKAMTFAYRIVGRQEEAEELVQDAFVRAFRSLDGFRGEAKFGTWFISILHNLCLTHIGRRKAREVSLEQLEGGRDQLADADDMDILDKLDQDERLRRLRNGMMRLPVQYREILTLFYVQELSYEEIAGVTGLPLGTVKTHLFRARSSLRNVLLDRTHKEVAGV